MDDLRYPIGKFRFPESVDPAELEGMIQSIEETPARLREAIDGLSPSQLDTPYRPEGWTLRQVVHHVPGSHLNAYVRCKLAVTEDHRHPRARGLVRGARRSRTTCSHFTGN